MDTNEQPTSPTNEQPTSPTNEQPTSPTNEQPTSPTAREEALEKTLNKYIDEHKKLQDELHKLKVSNAELALKVGLNRGNTEDILKQFSKYYKEEK